MGVHNCARHNKRRKPMRYEIEEIISVLKIASVKMFKMNELARELDEMGEYELNEEEKQLIALAIRICND